MNEVAEDEEEMNGYVCEGIVGRVETSIEIVVEVEKSMEQEKSLFQ